MNEACGGNTLEDYYIKELEQLLSETLAVQTEQDQRLAQLADELALKSALLEQAETNAAEVKRSAELARERRGDTDRLRLNITVDAEGSRAWETAGET